MYNVRQIKNQKWGVFVSVSDDFPTAEFATQEQAIAHANERNELLIAATERAVAVKRACNAAKRNHRKAA